jgi:tight adherence protein B
MSLRPAEFVVLTFTLALTVAAAVFLLAGTLTAIIAATAVVVGLRTWISLKASSRSEAFTEQLGQTVQLLAGSLRSGHALPQAVEVVAREAQSPTSDEFRRLVAELRLGRDMAYSFQAMSDRVRSQDFEWVVRAIEIHRQVGGNLAEVLDNIQVTIRDRNYVRRQFQSLSAEGRYSAYVLIALPFVVVAALLAINPDYIDVLFQKGAGRLLLVGAAANIAVGAIWVKALLRVKF